MQHAAPCQRVHSQAPSAAESAPAEDSTPAEGLRPPREEAPSLRALIAFTVPFMAVWVSNPLLGLIDTSVVGLGSTLELAALSPATSIANSLTYSLGFLGVVATSLVAGARARGATAEAQAATEEALAIAAFSGLALGALLLAAPEPIVTAFAGPTATELVPPAVVYTRIRALGVAAALVMTVAQAACLAYKDYRPALYATATAAGVNLVGDLVLCCGLGLGIGGAAWATVAAQLAAATVIVHRISQPCAQTGRPALFRRFPTAPPPLAVWARFAAIGWPVAAVICLKISYWCMCTSQATALSPVDSAAHGVLMSLFLVLGVLGDAVSQVAQAFMPAVLAYPEQAQQLARRLLYLGTLVGVANCTLFTASVTLLWGLFTTSLDVRAAMMTALPVTALCLLLHNASMASEGMMLACSRLRVLLKSYLLGAPAAMVTLVVLVGAGWGLPGVWMAVLQFQITRLAQNCWHLSPLSPVSPLLWRAAAIDVEGAQRSSEKNV